MDLRLLHNEATSALAAAKAIAEDADQDQAAYASAWTDYTEKLAAYNQAKELEAEDQRLRADRPTPGTDIDIRDSAIQTPTTVADVPAATANLEPHKYVNLGGGQIVPIADRLTEGFVKSYPVAVQRPEIMARYGPEMRAEAQMQREAFALYLRRGDQYVAKQRPDLLPFLNAMQEGTDSEGGYLVPSDQRTEIIHDPGAPSGTFRNASRILQTVRDSGTIPTGTTIAWAAIAEEATPADSDPVFGQVSFTIRKTGVNMKLSEEFLADEASDVQSFLNTIINEESGRYEDQQGIEGDGTTEPLGLRVAGAHGTVADVTDLITLAAPTFGEIVGAYYEVPAQFRNGNLRWNTTSSFMSRVMQITPAGGGQLWTMPNGTDAPVPRILGAPVDTFDGTGWDDAATIGANEELGALGDFNQYWFMDRLGVVVTRDDSVYTASDQVMIKARKRYDSFFAQANAFRVIKAAAS